ncbi:SgcJ/EcaC family oxidoreductase [Thiomicrorhabdus aquaedulcis]|uniref:SgcJ/EcaC family oxidoreductase n=1 Tax=Thiomicrorhabdus aquaedulcis TaxID=2211106 RepID=UPI000FDB476B|nr:SgcJ/EcaC family oxidoreductase [Thiomicrorhabdus aquaedulcis]
MKFEEVVSGSGAQAAEGKVVTVRVHAHNLSGRKITDCYVESFVLGQGQTMPALELLSNGMQVGGKRHAQVSPRYLYPNLTGMKGLLPNQTVILHIELLDCQNVAMDSQMQCTLITEQEVADLFDRWNASLQTKDARKVTDNYSKSAVLLPTVSNVPRTNHGAIEDYFEHFLMKNPVGRIDERHIHMGCNMVQDTGLYTFTLEGGQHVQARYSFIYVLENGHWVISHHHSSMMPEDMSRAH